MYVILLYALSNSESSGDDDDDDDNPRDAVLARSWLSRFCLPVPLSVRLSVTRLHFEKTKDLTAEFRQAAHE